MFNPFTTEARLYVLNAIAIARYCDWIFPIVMLSSAMSEFHTPLLRKPTYAGEVVKQSLCTSKYVSK